jgi:hypothetical protein
MPLTRGQLVELIAQHDNQPHEHRLRRLSRYSSGGRSSGGTSRYTTRSGYTPGSGYRSNGGGGDIPWWAIILIVAASFFCFLAFFGFRIWLLKRQLNPAPKPISALAAKNAPEEDEACSTSVPVIGTSLGGDRGMSGRAILWIAAVQAGSTLACLACMRAQSGSNRSLRNRCTSGAGDAAGTGYPATFEYANPQPCSSTSPTPSAPAYPVSVPAGTLGYSSEASEYERKPGVQSYGSSAAQRPMV